MPIQVTTAADMNPLNLRTARYCTMRTMVSKDCTVCPRRIRRSRRRQGRAELQCDQAFGRSPRKEFTSSSSTPSPLRRKSLLLALLSAQLSSIPPPIKFYDFQTRKITQIGAIEKEVIRGYTGFSVTWDGRYMAWSQIDRGESDLMMIENFR